MDGKRCTGEDESGHHEQIKSEKRTKTRLKSFKANFLTRVLKKSRILYCINMQNRLYLPVHPCSDRILHRFMDFDNGVQEEK